MSSSSASAAVASGVISFPSAPQSRLDPSFWEAIYRLKLDKFKLDNSQKVIAGVVPLTTSSVSSSSSFDCVSFSEDSFANYLRTSPHSLSPPAAPAFPFSGESLRNPFVVQGTILNCNTIEEFKAIDKKEYIEKISSDIWGKICNNVDASSSGEAAFDLSDLLRFSLIAFADLKTYKFTYWFAFPAFIPSSPFRLLDLPTSFYNNDSSSSSGASVEGGERVERTILLKTVKSLSGSLSGSDFLRSLNVEMHKLWDRCLMESSPDNSSDNSCGISAGGGGSKVSPKSKVSPFLKSLAVVIALTADGSLTCKPLDDSSFEEVVVKYESSKNITSTTNEGSVVQYWIGILDGQSPKGNHVLSWHNRNILAYINSLFIKYKLSDVSYLDLICIRGRFWTFSWNHFVSNMNKSNERSASSSPSVLLFDDNQDKSSLMRWSLSEKYFQFEGGGNSVSQVKVFGWELNDKGKPGPSVANLANTLDPATLMTQAIDLNIRLMRWRLWTSLENDKIAKTKCLLFGAGTLGCAIARCLLGWGIKHITLIDNGLVSYSNPARQMLFEFDDALHRKPKATTAAERLRSIYPQVEARGIVCNIPMPGHAFSAATAGGAASTVGVGIGGSGSTQESEGGSETIAFHDTIDKLDSLVQEHDVIFNLTDSREARWFPTLLSAVHNKLMISVALGFDTYLVMRHGLKGRAIANAANPIHRHEHAGCYFCSDIVAATNSMRDRSMDQQCTVTRPGSSFISSGTAVELMVSYLHNLGYPDLSNNDPLSSSSESSSPSESTKSATNSEDEDVRVPHQIRGNLSGFSQFLPNTPAFPQCTACSEPIIAAYSADKFKFMQSVCERPELLQDISGISALTANIDDDCDWDDESEKGGGSESD